MKLNVRRTNSAELTQRKNGLSQELQSSVYDRIEGAPMRISDLEDLAGMGLLSHRERELYDELLRVKFLLGE